MRAKGVTISSISYAFKSIVFTASFFVVANVFATDIAAEGMRIPGYQEVLKKVHTDATRFEEIKVDPAKSGGSTLMGLISRLMGSQPNSEFEGVGVQRYIYTAFKGDKLLGVSHGSSIEVDGKLIHVLVHYDGDATVKSVEITDAPSEVAATLKSQKFLEQFKGLTSEDFQTTYEKHRRRLVTHQARAMRSLRFPSTGLVKNYFERIVRALRYNVAFVDVAYFISRLPMMDFSSRRISSVARSAGSPETMVQNANLSSPTGDRGRTFIQAKP